MPGRALVNHACGLSLAVMAPGFDLWRFEAEPAMLEPVLTRPQ